MQFFKRNSPIFIIGLLAALIFGVLIIIGQNSSSGINLKETLEATFNISSRSNTEPEDVYTPPTETSLEETLVDPPGREIIKEPIVIPDLIISFDGEKFIPKSTQTINGQVVTWVNNSGKTITIVELINKFKEFSEGVTLKPGESFTLKLYKDKIWTYKETATEAIGRMLIGPGYKD